MSRRGKWARPTAEERFATRYAVNAASGCWEWTGKRDPKGYGVLQRGGGGPAVWVRAHRLAASIYIRDPLPGEVVCHRCDNPCCVNPAHLFIGTPRENTLDMLRKGRGTVGTRNASAKLTGRDVKIIRADEHTPARQLADRFGVSPKTIRNCRFGRTYGGNHG